MIRWISKRIRRCASGLATIALISTAAMPSASAQTAFVIDIEGGIGAATVDILESGMDEAAAAGASVIVLRMNTPGGLDSAMRDIVSTILASEIPVATWVGPAGARAASAGTYILLASHVAAMHSTSHLGAATPVSLGGGGVTDDKPGPGGLPLPGGTPDSEDQDGDAAPSQTARNPDAMGRKILNDAVSYIRGLAERHGRNADWAERAVRDGATLTAAEAFDENVIDLLADSVPALLESMDGRTVSMEGGGSVTLATRNLTVQEFEPSFRQKVLTFIANPSVALLLGLIGVYGLFLEGSNPGALVPGIVGAICLLLAAYSLQLLPVNYAGLLLMLLGLALIVAEIFVPSFGALGLGGIVAFVVGAIMTFNTGVPGFSISLWSVGALSGVAALLIFGTVSFAVKLNRRGAVSGKEGLLKDIAVAVEDFDGDGHVWVESERWRAHSQQPVRKGEQLRVTRVDGLVVHVEPLGGSPD